MVNVCFRSFDKEKGRMRLYKCRCPYCGKITDKIILLRKHIKNHLRMEAL